MMVDMSHFNNRCIQGMECCALFIIAFLAGIILIFYGVFMSVTFPNFWYENYSLIYPNKFVVFNLILLKVANNLKNYFNGELITT